MRGISGMPSADLAGGACRYRGATPQPELELIVTAYNINAKCSPKLMDSCHLLKEYAQYVEQVRIHTKTEDLPQAVEKAIDYCIHNGILADFLSKNRAEAIAMSTLNMTRKSTSKTRRRFLTRKDMNPALKRDTKRVRNA